MPLSETETELVELVQRALADAYPGRALEVNARPHFVGWLEIVVREQGRAGVLQLTEPVNRERITRSQLRELSDSILDSVIRQLGRPGRVA